MLSGIKPTRTRLEENRRTETKPPKCDEVKTKLNTVIVTSVETALEPITDVVVSDNWLGDICNATGGILPVGDRGCESQEDSTWNLLLMNSGDQVASKECKCTGNTRPSFCEKSPNETASYNPRAGLYCASSIIEDSNRDLTILHPPPTLTETSESPSTVITPSMGSPILDASCLVTGSPLHSRDNPANDEIKEETNCINKREESDGSNRKEETNYINRKEESDGSNRKKETNYINRKEETDGSNRKEETNYINRKEETDGGNRKEETNYINRKEETDGSNRKEETNCANRKKEESDGLTIGCTASSTNDCAEVRGLLYMYVV